MKKVFAIIIITVLLVCSLVCVLAAPSPTTSAVIGGITVETDSEEITISKEIVDSYVDIIHVHEAKVGSALYEISEQLKKDDKLDDKNLGDVLGEEFADSKLIQLFVVENKDKISGNIIVVGNFALQEDGTYKIEDPKTVIVKGGLITIRLDCPSVREDMDVRLIQNINGQWVQAEHVRAYNGYITFDFDLSKDFGSVWAVTVDKAPISPPTGESLNVVYFILFTIAVIGTAVVTRKYLTHK